MNHSFEQELSIKCECGEITVLLGSEEDWRARRPVFRCECGQKFTLDGHTEEEVLAAS